MIFDLAFKWVQHLFRSQHLFPIVHLSKVEWQLSVPVFMSLIGGWLEANTFINVYGWQNKQLHYVGRQQTWRIHRKWSTIAISKRKMHILYQERLRICSFSLMCGATLRTLYLGFQWVQVYISFILLHYISSIYLVADLGGGCSPLPPPCHLKEYGRVNVMI